MALVTLIGYRRKRPRLTRNKLTTMRKPVRRITTKHPKSTAPLEQWALSQRRANPNSSTVNCFDTGLDGEQGTKKQRPVHLCALSHTRVKPSHWRDLLFVNRKQISLVRSDTRRSLVGHHSRNASLSCASDCSHRQVRCTDGRRRRQENLITSMFECLAFIPEVLIESHRVVRKDGPQSHWYSIYPRRRWEDHEQAHTSAVFHAPCVEMSHVSGTFIEWSRHEGVEKQMSKSSFFDANERLTVGG